MRFQHHGAKSLKKKCVLLFVFFLASFHLNAQSFGDGFPGGETCDTTGKYDANTKITFFGDSRMQLAHSLRKDIRALLA